MSIGLSVTHTSSAGQTGAQLLHELGLQALLRWIWTTVQPHLAARYRPERHYMRGPGPRCREKAIGTTVLRQVSTAVALVDRRQNPFPQN